MSKRSPLLALPAPSRLWPAFLALSLTLTLALPLTLAPSLAEARAGKSYSSGGASSGASGMGSRGSRTFERNDAAPVTRSMNPSTTQAARPAGAGPAAATGAAQPSFFQRHPLLTGLAGGFLGAALFSHLGLGAGMSQMFGGLLMMLLIGGLIFLAIRFFASRRAGATGGGMSRGPLPASVGAAAAPSAARYRGTDTTVDDADLNAFQAIHAAVQEAWSSGDLGRLRQVMTPEMLGYFSEELTSNTSEGVQNVVSDVRLLQGDITESWDDGGLKYATAYMKWSAIDYVARLGRSPGTPDYIVSGDPKQPVESEEVWTFVRQSHNGNWLLSAIQQV
jgi:predicted lipid-binding transport protein (Tim44 family)